MQTTNSPKTTSGCNFAYITIRQLLHRDVILSTSRGISAPIYLPPIDGISSLQQHPTTNQTMIGYKILFIHPYKTYHPCNPYKTYHTVQYRTARTIQPVPSVQNVPHRTKHTKRTTPYNTVPVPYNPFHP